MMDMRVFGFSLQFQKSVSHQRRVYFTRVDTDRVHVRYGAESPLTLDNQDDDLPKWNRDLHVRPLDG